MSKIVFGADPEYFASVEKDGQLFAVPPYIFRKDWGVETITDDPRHPIFMEVNGVKIHEDGAAFEMSLSPSENWKELFERISLAREYFAKEFLSKFDVIPELKALPSIHWDVDGWNSRADDEFKMATEFGCDPDRDAFNTRARERVFDASLHPWRYGGGHIHFSGVEEIKESPVIAVKCLALTAGLGAVIMSDVPHLERERVFRYGKPGKYRVQKYGKLFNEIPNTDVGIEYRTLSNRWTGSFEVASEVFRLAEFGINELLVKKGFSKISDDVIQEACEAITNFDQEKARQVLSVVEGV